MPLPLLNDSFVVSEPFPSEPFVEAIQRRSEYIVCSASTVRDMEESFFVFTQKLEAEIDLLPENALLIVFPEYCWRTTPPQEVFGYIKQLRQKISPELTLVLGTLEFTLNGSYTNNAIVICGEKSWYIPKTKILQGEVAQGIVPGVHPGIIQLPHFKLAVIVCADLWEATLLHELVLKQCADLVAVPSWTATKKGNRKWAKQDFVTLAKARSLEFSVPVIVSDHFHNRPQTDVGNALTISDPSDRQKKLPLDEKVIRLYHLICIEKVKHARSRWQAKGLAPFS